MASSKDSTSTKIDSIWSNLKLASEFIDLSIKKYRDDEDVETLPHETVKHIVIMAADTDFVKSLCEDEKLFVTDILFCCVSILKGSFRSFTIKVIIDHFTTTGVPISRERLVEHVDPINLAAFFMNVDALKCYIKEGFPVTKNLLQLIANVGDANEGLEYMYESCTYMMVEAQKHMK